jgi:leucyl-tRNA synthetase
MMLECVEEFTADATRFTLADAGDSLEDANFDRTVVNTAISSLYIEDEFCRAVLQDAADGKLRTGEFTFMDECLNNELDSLIEATFNDFQAMCYRDGIHRCWYDLIIARDFYRDWSNRCATPFHADVMTRFVHALCVMMAPITPHWSEKIWAAIAPFPGKSSTVCDAKWPAWKVHDKFLRKKYNFFRKTYKTLHLTLSKTKLTKGEPVHAYLYYATNYDAEKVAVLQWLQTQYDADKNTFPEDLLSLMKSWCEEDPERKKNTKTAMQFGSFMKAEALERGADALATEQPFDQAAIIEENRTFIVNSLEVASFEAVNVSNAAGGPIPGDKKAYSGCVPGKPSVLIYNAKAGK